MNQPMQIKDAQKEKPKIPMLRTLIEKGFVISQGDKIYQKLSLNPKQERKRKEMFNCDAVVI